MRRITLIQRGHTTDMTSAVGSSRAKPISVSIFAANQPGVRVKAPRCQRRSHRRLHVDGGAATANTTWIHSRSRSHSKQTSVPLPLLSLTPAQLALCTVGSSRGCAVSARTRAPRALKATHAALVKEVGAARARNLEEVAARTYPSLGHGARRKLMGLDAGANGGSGSPSGGGDASSSSGSCQHHTCPPASLTRGEAAPPPAPGKLLLRLRRTAAEDPKSAGGRRSGDAGAGSPAGASGHGLYASGVAMAVACLPAGRARIRRGTASIQQQHDGRCSCVAAPPACGACDDIPSAACGQSHGAVGTAMGGGGLQMSRSMPALGGGPRLLPHRRRCITARWPRCLILAVGRGPRACLRESRLGRFPSAYGGTSRRRSCW